MQLYSHSKLANILFAHELTEKLRGTGKTNIFYLLQLILQHKRHAQDFNNLPPTIFQHSTRISLLIIHSHISLWPFRLSSCMYPLGYILDQLPSFLRIYPIHFHLDILTTSPVNFSVDISHVVVFGINWYHLIPNIPCCASFSKATNFMSVVTKLFRDSCPFTKMECTADVYIGSSWCAV